MTPIRVMQILLFVLLQILLRIYTFADIMTQI